MIIPIVFILEQKFQPLDLYKYKNKNRKVKHPKTRAP